MPGPDSEKVAAEEEKARNKKAGDHFRRASMYHSYLTSLGWDPQQASDFANKLAGEEVLQQSDRPRPMVGPKGQTVTVDPSEANAAHIRTGGLARDLQMEALLERRDQRMARMSTPQVEGLLRGGLDLLPQHLAARAQSHVPLWAMVPPNTPFSSTLPATPGPSTDGLSAGVGGTFKPLPAAPGGVYMQAPRGSR